MSTDYTFSLQAGFLVTANALEARFGKRIPAKTHYEPRFDQKTGNRLPPLRVVDEGPTMSYVFDGKTYLEEEDADDSIEVRLVRAISRKLRCSFAENFSNYSDSSSFVLGPKMPRERNCLETGHVTSTGDVPMAALLKMGPELDRIQRELRALGFKTSTPQLYTTYLIS